MSKVSILLIYIVLVLMTACTTNPTVENNGETAQILGSPTSIPNAIATPSPKAPFQPQPSIRPNLHQTSVPTEHAILSPTPTVSPEPTIPPAEPIITGTVENPGNAIIIDHTSVDLFDSIPEQYLSAARALKLLFSDRSVGQNINDALNCFTAPSWEDSPAACRRDYVDSNWNWKTFRLADRMNGSVTSRILFNPDPIRYNRENWTYEFTEGSWSELTGHFISELAPRYLNSKDVLSYQFTYLNVANGEDIADPVQGFFSDNPDRYDIYDLEAFISQHPEHTFVFWTTSLARGIGSETAQQFNDQMRQYVLSNGKILFDVADIEAHTDQGIPCYDNRDGIEYCSQSGKCENHPDDGKNLLAICQDYTTETDGGHLGSVSAGHIRLVKALWVLMARIAGWDGNLVNAP